MKQKLILSIVVLALSIINFASAEISNDYGGSRSIHIREGWNLVTIYTVKEIESIADGNLNPPSGVDAVFVYDRYVGEYFRLFPQPESEKFYQLLNSVGDPEKRGDKGEYGGLVNMSVWLHSDKDQVINYYSVDGPLPHKHVNIRSGWNFLSVTPEYVGQTFNQLKGNCEVIKVGTFDTATNSWDMMTESQRSQKIFEENTIYEVGRGMVVKVTNSCKMGTNILIPAVPPLPN